MIEEDIRYLEGQIQELSDNYRRLVNAISEGRFQYVIDKDSYSQIAFDTEQEAWDWIESQKSRDKKTFKKKSLLRFRNIDWVKPQRRLYGF